MPSPSILTQQRMPEWLRGWPAILGKPISLVPVKQGLDGQNYIVKASVIAGVSKTTSRYFIKRLKSQDNGLHVARLTQLAELVAPDQLTPQILFSDLDAGYIVFDYIEGHSLNTIELSDAEQSQILAAMLKKIHSLPFSVESEIIHIEKLDFGSVAENLQNGLQSSVHEQKTRRLIADLFSRFTEQVLAPIEALLAAKQTANDLNLCICHGDLNFTNIIARTTSNRLQQRYSVVDFDAVCLAPCEYDLGMAIAINNLQGAGGNALISDYRKLREEIEVTRPLVTLFSIYSAYINYLWCLVSLSEKCALSEKRQGLMSLAYKQASQLESHSLLNKQERHLLEAQFGQ